MLVGYQTHFERISRQTYLLFFYVFDYFTHMSLFTVTRLTFFLLWISTICHELSGVVQSWISKIAYSNAFILRIEPINQICGQNCQLLNRFLPTTNDIDLNVEIKHYLYPMRSLPIPDEFMSGRIPAIDQKANYYCSYLLECQSNESCSLFAVRSPFK